MSNVSHYHLSKQMNPPGSKTVRGNKLKWYKHSHDLGALRHVHMFEGLQDYGKTKKSLLNKYTLWDRKRLERKIIN